MSENIAVGMLGFPNKREPEARLFLMAMFAGHKRQAEHNHRQSLRRLAERGGLSWCEAAAILKDRAWEQMPIDKAKAIVLSAAAEPTP